jgi:hypothetical protein
MSLVSASNAIGGIKEYTFRGIQELPLVLGLTSLLFTVTTGSIAHGTMALGLGVIMPIFTGISQKLLSILLKWTVPERETEWTRSFSDTCRIIPSYSNKALGYYTGANESRNIPSFWITSIGFFFGYVLSNSVDTLMKPAAPNSDPVGHEKRNTQALLLLITTSVFFIMLMTVRLVYMRDCEGRGWLGRLISIIFCAAAIGIGYGMYRLSKICGARSSDLFGVLSQILPAAAIAPSPVVCTSEL